MATGTGSLCFLPAPAPVTGLFEKEIKALAAPSKRAINFLTDIANANIQLAPAIVALTEQRILSVFLRSFKNNKKLALFAAFLFAITDVTVADFRVCL